MNIVSGDKFVLYSTDLFRRKWLRFPPASTVRRLGFLKPADKPFQGSTTARLQSPKSATWRAASLAPRACR